MDKDCSDTSLVNKLLASGSSQEFLLKAQAFNAEFDRRTVIGLMRGLPGRACLVEAMTEMISAGVLDVALSEPSYSLDFFLSGAKRDKKQYMRFGALDEYVDSKPYLDYDWRANPSKEAREQAEREFADRIKLLFSAAVRRIELAHGKGIPSVEAFKRRNGL